MLNMQRYESLYSKPYAMRVGVSSPVCFNSKTQRYNAFIIHTYRGVIAFERPSQYDHIITFEAGQYASDYPAVICG